MARENVELDGSLVPLTMNFHLNRWFSSSDNSLMLGGRKVREIQSLISRTVPGKLFVAKDQTVITLLIV